jgi:hypothetical protein
MSENKNKPNGAEEETIPVGASAVKEDAHLSPEQLAAAQAAADLEVLQRLKGGGKYVGPARLEYTEKDIQRGGLFLGQIESVKVEYSDIDAASNGMGNLAGHTVPRLVITWHNGAEESKRKYVTQSFLPVESNLDTFAGGKLNWRSTNITSYLLHYIEVFVTHKRDMPPMPIARAIAQGFRDAEYPLVNGKPNYNAAPSYVSVLAEEVIADYERRFVSFAKLMNNGCDEQGNIREDNDPKAASVFKTAAGGVNCWILLYRSIRIKGEWHDTPNGKFDFPNFVGTGAFEIAKNGVEPVLLFDSSSMSHKPMGSTNPKRTPPVGGGYVPGGGVTMPYNPAGVGAGSFNQYSPNPTGDADASPLPF